MLTQRRFSLAAVSAIAMLGSAFAANATSVEVIASPLHGKDDTSVRILLTEDAGNIVVSLAVDQGLADLRAVFLNIFDDSKLKGLTVTGEDVTSFAVRERKHGDKGDKDRDSDDGDHHWGDKDHHWGKGGKDHHWGDGDGDDDEHHKHGFGRSDIAIALGTSFSKDGLLETTFVLDAKADLTISDFAGELIGVRVARGGDGECKGEGDKECEDHDGGSLVLVAQVPPQPVPEPTAAALLAFGLGALGCARRTRR